jgi:universal stress protein A
MPETPFQTVICPVDFSQCSTHALKFGQQLAAATGARLVVLHAIYVELPAYFTEGSQVALLEEVQAARQETEQRLRECVQRELGPGVQAEIEVIDMEPVHAIEESAARHPNSVIVMGTHGRRGLERLMLGSVTEKVLRRANVPVVTVRG